MRTVIDEKDFYLKRGILSSETAADWGQDGLRLSLKSRKTFPRRASYSVLVEGPDDLKSAYFSGDIDMVYAQVRLSENQYVLSSLGFVLAMLKKSASALGERPPF